MTIREKIQKEIDVDHVTICKWFKRYNLTKAAKDE